MRCVVAFVLLFGGLMFGQLLALVPPIQEALTREDNRGYLTLAALQVCCGAIVVALMWAWLRLVERRTLASVGWRVTRSSALWLILGAAVSGAVVTVASLLPLSGRNETGGLAEAAANGNIATPVVLLLLLTQSFALQGIPEELIFRGWLLDVVRRRGPWLGLVVSSVAFAVPHLLSSGGQQNVAERLMYLAIPFGFGLCGAALVYATGSLWSAVGVHGGFHVATGLSIALGASMPGPIGWLVIGVLFVVASAIALVASRRRSNLGQLPQA